MPDEPPSLILAEQSAPAQLSFFEENSAYEALEGVGEFTGERLFRRQPERYQLCVRMIAEGLATRQIARALKVSHNTIEAVRRREKVPIDTEKEHILRDVRAAARLSVERVIEMAPTMTGRDAAITAGIMIEKMQLLSGEATTIVGKEEGLKHADFNALIEALPLANVREVSSEIGYLGDPPTQKEVSLERSGTPELPTTSDPAHLEPLSTPERAQNPSIVPHSGDSQPGQQSSGEPSLESPPIA